MFKILRTLCVASLVGTTACAVLGKDLVTVAFVGPLSGAGGVAPYGVGARNSADLAVRLKNADPNAKYRYELVSMDDECRPNVGVQVATKIASDKKIVGAITHYCSAVALATVDIYHQFGLPSIIWGAILPELTSGANYPHITRVNGTMVTQDRAAAKFMRAQGYKRWAIVHDTTDYGKGHDRYFTRFVTEAGGEVIGHFGVSADQQDFTAELTKVKTLNPDVIYFAGLAQLGVRVRSQMDRLGMSGIQFQGDSGIVSDVYPQSTGALAEGSVALSASVPTEKLPGGKTFLENYKQAGYRDAPELMGPFAFSATSILLNAIEKVGPDRKKVTAAIAATKNADSVVGPITFDKEGQNELAMITTYVVQDGKWIPFEDSEYASGKRQFKKKNK